MNVEIFRLIRLKLSMCGCYFDKCLNVHNREQTEEFEVHTAEPWIPESSEIEIEMSVKNLKISNHQE